MKKFLSFFAAGLLLASCSNDDFAPKGAAGSEEEVTISVTLPDDIASRAVAGGENSKDGGVLNNADAVTFTVALYYNNGTTPVFTGTATATANPRTAVFKPTLVIGETYQLVAYAQFDGEADLNAQAEAFGLNNEKTDAYFLSTDIVAEPVMYGELKRHTGKLRLIALDYGLMKSQLQKDIANVTVTYEDARYTTFNSRTGEWTGAAAETAYTAERIDYNTEDYDAQATYTTDESVAKAKTVFVDYIPVNTSGDEHVSIVVDVEFTDGSTFTREINLDIPIKRNYLTTLVGNFFTSEMELTLVIDPIFEKEEVYNYNDLATAFDLGGEYKLYNNIVLNKAVVLDGKDLVLDLNGYSITTVDGADAIIVNNGTLTINGDGYVTTEDKTAGYAVIVDGANAKAIINGGTYTIGLDDVAVYGQSSCNSAVYTKNGGTAEINGGFFQVKTTQAIDEVSLTRYLINKQDQTGGDIAITGGSYVKFNPANNVAEGANTNFVAEGYGVTVDGDVYTVTPAAVDGVTTLNKLSDLVWFAAQVNGGNTFEGETIALGVDIDLAGATWEPIGNGLNKFSGSFDGQNHTVSNFVVETADYAGFFGNVFKGGSAVSVKNLNIKDATINANHFAGAVVASTYGNVTGCSATNVTITLSADNENGDKVGGIVGYVGEGGYKVTDNKVSNVTIKGYRDLGGVVGCAQKGVTVSGNSVDNVEITADQVTGFYGDKAINAHGIVGRDNGATIENNTESNVTVNVVTKNVAAALANGGNVTLLEDAVISETITVSNTAVLNLNGKTITNKVENASTDVIVVAEGAELTINGDGAVTAVTGNDGYAIISKGVLTINGGTYRSGLDTKNDGNCTIYAMGNGKVYIKGGNFSTTEEDTTTHIINKKDADRATTVIEISGGTFTNFNPGNNAAEGAGTNFLAAGYKSVETAEGSNVWTVVAE